MVNDMVNDMSVKGAYSYCLISLQLLFPFRLALLL